MNHGFNPVFHEDPGDQIPVADVRLYEGGGFAGNGGDLLHDSMEAVAEVVDNHDLMSECHQFHACVRPDESGSARN